MEWLLFACKKPKILYSLGLKAIDTVGLVKYIAPKGYCCRPTPGKP